jgi:hypothetical protein
MSYYLTNATYKAVHTCFHTLWGKAVGTPDYDKNEWKLLQKLIDELYQAQLDALHAAVGVVPKKR